MNIELKKKKERSNAVIRRVLNILIALFSYVFISTISTGAEVPLLLIPCAVCYAVREEPLESAVYGAFCGLLLDSAAGTIPGFNAIILLWSCLMVSLLFHAILRRHILNFLWLDFAVIALQSALHYLFFYWLWEFDSDGLIMGKVFIPEAIYTNIAGVILFIITGFIANRFGRVTEHYIEEKNGDIVRE